MTPSQSLPATVSSWIERWMPILPLLVAEFVVWLGFGAMLPVMPLYFRDHGVDLETLGIVIAAWPAARLVGEPVFGWLADRIPRVPLMVAGNLAAGVFQFLPLLLVGPLPFFVLRGLQGLATAMYDPAARGYIADATPAERRGEAFGLYGASQMGGLLLGPAIGGVGAAVFGGIGFVWAFGALSSWLAALAIGVRVRESRQASGSHPRSSFDATEFPARPVAAKDDLADRSANIHRGAAPSLKNRLLVAAVVLNVAGNFAAGTYEVIWSIFLDGLGAGVELIGLTFATFGLPILILSPAFGRRIDRGGLVTFVVIGGLAPPVAGVLYTFMTDPVQAIPLILVESTGFAMLNPALYAIVAAGSPPGRSSTAQGIYGAAGTSGFIVASLITGVLADVNVRLPFYVFSIVGLVCLVAGLLVGGRALPSIGRETSPATATSG